MLKYRAMGENVYASFFSLYHPQHRAWVKRLADVVQRAVPIFHERLKFPDDQTVIIRRMDDHDRGSFVFRGQSIHLNHSNCSVFQFIETLAHELVHSEQFYTGKLGFETSNNPFAKLSFNGEEYYLLDGLLSYPDNPWEIEAYERQEELRDHVLRIFERDGYDISDESQIDMDKS